MVEPRQILPFHGRVTGLAAQWLASAVQSRHALGKLSFVNVLMASGAPERVEMIESYLRVDGRFVAFVARNGYVPPGQRPVGLLVLTQRVAGGLEGDSCMALFTAVTPWFVGKLALVLILMAIHAERKLHPVTSLLACWDMTACALHLGVRRHERKAGFGVAARCVGRRAPAIHRVATLAPPPVGALLELASMLVFMAIHAICKRDRRIEVRGLVASQAGHINMLAQQRKLRLRMIESCSEGRSLPRRGGMAGFAALLEVTLVRIGVAVRTT